MGLEPIVYKLIYIFCWAFAWWNNGTDAPWVFMNLFQKVDSSESGMFRWETECIRVLCEIIFVAWYSCRNYFLKSIKVIASVTVVCLLSINQWLWWLGQYQCPQISECNIMKLQWSYIDIIHGTGLETNHVRHLVVYIFLPCNVCLRIVCGYVTVRACEKENNPTGNMYNI